jgi:hypothetical protein
MEKANEFMFLFRFNPEGPQPTEEEMAESQQQWGPFIGGIAQKGKLVSTHQLGFNGVQISSSGETSEGIYMSESLTLGGNMIVSAGNMEEATEMAKGCPILQMGGTIEVREITPM